MAKSKQQVVTTTVQAEVRTSRGSRASQRLRAEGLLPAIVYGHKQDPVAITIPAVLTTTVIHSGAHVMDLALNGKTEKVLIQAVGYDYLQTTIEHVDLMRIDPNERVKVSVALEFRGTPKGAKEGGILETQLTEVDVETSALTIPASIRVNVENLELHGVLHAKDVAMPEGCKLLNNPEQIVASVRMVKETVVAPAEGAAATAEPEVIGKKKEDEEGAGEAGKAPAKAPAKK